MSLPTPDALAGGNISGQWFSPMGSGAPSSSGDYISASGGMNTYYLYYIEVTPGLSRLEVDIFDMDIGAGSLERSGNYSEQLDRRRGSRWNTSTRYRLYTPSGSRVYNTTVRPGYYSSRHNTWYNIYGVNNPAPGHWQLRVNLSSSVTSGDDINSYGVRAHDGDPSAGGTEVNIYAPSYLQIGVHDGDGNPRSGESRTIDFYPYITEMCNFNVADFDFDNTDTGPFTSSLSILSRAGTGLSVTESQMSGDDVWASNTLGNWNTDVWSGDYGIWFGQFTIFERYSAGGNYGTIYAITPQGSSPPPSSEPEANSIRMYLPTDAGGAPVKPYLTQMLGQVSGPNPPVAGQTTRIRVQVTFVNPTPYAITFVGSTQAIAARVPAGSDPGAAECAYADNITVTQGSIRTQPAVGSGGPIVWDPGTIAGGASITMTYDVDVTPSSTGQRVPVTATRLGASVPGTAANFTDETGVAAATFMLGPLCDLAITEGGPIPTLVTLSRFEANEEDDGVTVEWETSSELGTAGFHLLRFDIASGEFVRVNKRLLPAVRHSPQGGVYRIVDPDAEPGEKYAYKLVEIEARGKRRTYGPFQVTVAAAKPRRQQRLARSGGGSVIEQRFASKSRDLPAAKRARLGAARSLRNAASLRRRQRRARDQAKVSLTEKGIYFLSAEDIAAALKRPGNVRQSIRRSRLRLSHQGTRVSFLPAPDHSGIYFYGEKLDSLYTNENVYWLSRGFAPKMQTVKLKPGAPVPGEQTFAERLSFEEDRYPLTGLFSDPEADYWFWDYCISGAPGLAVKTFAFRTDGVESAGGQATLTVHLQGATDTEANPDHHAVIRLNGTPIGEAQWDGTAAHATGPMAFDASLLIDGENTLEIEGVLDTGAPYSVFYLDSFEVAYQRRYEAAGDALLCRGDGHGTIAISGFTSPAITVFDLTDPAKPKLVTGTRIDAVGDTHRVTFRPQSPQTPYLAWVPAAAKAPMSVIADLPSSLKQPSNAADYVVIAPTELADAAQALAEYRRSHGLSAMVVDLENIYDEFNHGIADARAIRTFLHHARRRWRRPPRYVVLAGEGTYDYKDALGVGDSRLMPPMMVGTTFGLFASDNWYADLDGNDGVPELAIGRLPVASVEELQTMIAKIIAQETGTGEWRDRVMMVADNPDDGGFFPADSDALAAMIPPPYRTDKVYLRSDSLEESRRQLFAGIADGALMMNYLGHAALDRFAGEGLLTTADVDALSNGDRLPVITAFTCTAGRFALPGYDCLAEALLVKDGGGSVAVWGPAGIAWHEESNALAQGFFTAAFGSDKPVLGDAVRTALASYAAASGEMDTIKAYNLLGDPAQRLFGERATGAGTRPQLARGGKRTPTPPTPESMQGDDTPPGKDDNSGTEGGGKDGSNGAEGGSGGTTVFGGGTMASGIEAAGATSDTGSRPPPGMRVVEQDGTRTVLEIVAPVPRRVAAEGKTERLEIDGYALTDSPGDPQLPVRGFAIPIPEGTTPTATVLETETVEIEDIAVPPAPRFTVADLSDSKSRLAENGTWVMAPVATAPSPAYSADADWPGQIAKAELGGKMGARTLAFLTVTPVTYNPVSRTARFHSRIRVALDVAPVAAGQASGSKSGPLAWQPPGDALKLRTTGPGMHRVTAAQVRAAGQAAGDARRLALYYRGTKVPIFVQGEADGQLGGSDYLEFLATPNPNPACGESVYWLVAGREPGLRMAQIDATPPTEGEPASVQPHTVALNEARQVLFVGDAMSLPERWILAEVGPGATEEFVLRVCGPDASQPAHIRILTTGAADPAQASVELNGKALGDGLEIRYDAGKLRHGDNTLAIRNRGPEPLWVKQIAITYLPDIREAKPGMALSASGGQVLTLSGLPEPLSGVYDVTTGVPARLLGIENIKQGQTWSARFAVVAGHSYQIEDPASSEAVSVERDRASDLSTARRGADYVIITHADFDAAASKLALHRASQGRRVEVVDVEDVLDEFAYGEPDPEAIRRFLAHAYANWSPGVRQAVLLGDGAAGCRADGNFVPVHVEVIGSVATASDSWYACVDGDDRLPDIRLGRLPVRSAAEAQYVVKQLIAYDFLSAEEQWAHRLFYAGDEIPVPSGAAEARALANKSDVLQALADGGLLLTVLTSGRIDALGGLLSASDLGPLTAQGGSPLLVSLAASHVFFQSTSTPSLPEALLRTRGGIVGAVANSGLMPPRSARAMTEAVVQTALSPEAKQDLGGLLDAGRLSLIGQDGIESALRSCLLLGDPATVLKAPASPATIAPVGPASPASPLAPQAPAPSDGSPYAMIWQVLSPNSGGNADNGKGVDGTPLDLILKATMVDRAVPYAIVQEGSGRQRLVKVGDRVAGAQVLAITPKAVVLELNGQELQIELHTK